MTRVEKIAEKVLAELKANPDTTRVWLERRPSTSRSIVAPFCTVAELRLLAKAVGKGKK
jgi:hypothetical protein